MGRLDPSIPLGVRAPRLMDLVDSYDQGKEARRRSRLADLEAKEAPHRSRLLELQVKDLEGKTQEAAKDRESKERLRPLEEKKAKLGAFEAFVEARNRAVADVATRAIAMPETRRRFFMDEEMAKLSREGLDVKDFENFDVTDQSLGGLVNLGLSQEKRADLKVTTDKKKLEEAQRATFEQWRKGLDPELQAKGFDLAQADINRIAASFPATLSGYKPAEDFINNLKTKPQPPPGTIYTPRQQFQDVTSLRKDFDDQPEIKALKVVAGKADQMNALWSRYVDAKNRGEQQAQFSDQVLAVNFNKLIDEASAVMPGEFARTAEGAGLTDALVARIQSAVTGGLKFNDTQRQEIINVANVLVDSMRDRARPTYDLFRSEAGSMKFDPARITGHVDHLLKPRPAPTRAHPQDAAAIEWARQNPADPRAQKILQANGAR
jgi:hypothetical protein